VSFKGRSRAKIVRGVIFCQVDKIKHEIHEIEAMTEGYQKWQGALPSFKSTDVVSKIGIKFGIKEEYIHIDILDINSNADPNACARKYFTDPSVSWLFLVCSMMGINLSKLSSIAPHRRIQFVLDKAMRVLINSDNDVSIIIGE